MLLSAPKLDSPITLQVDREPQAAPASHPTWVSSAHRETEYKRNRRKFRRNSDETWTEFRRNERRKKKKNGIATFLKMHTNSQCFSMVRGRARTYVREVLELDPGTTLMYLRLSSAEILGKSIPMQHVGCH